MTSLFSYPANYWRQLCIVFRFHSILGKLKTKIVSHSICVYGKKLNINFQTSIFSLMKLYVVHLFKNFLRWENQRVNLHQNAVILRIEVCQVSWSLGFQTNLVKEMFIFCIQLWTFFVYRYEASFFQKIHGLKNVVCFLNRFRFSYYHINSTIDISDKTENAHCDFWFFYVKNWVWTTL